MVLPYLFAGDPARFAPDALKLLISVEQPSVRAPYPLEVILHIHNTSQEPLWLYRRPRHDAREGSSVRVHLEPVAQSLSRVSGSGLQGQILEAVGFPKPKLVRVAPGEDVTEKVSLKVSPAANEAEGESPPAWGRYRLSVTYAARYSNGATLRRILGAGLWEGEVTSNWIEVELLPAAGEGSITGKVVSKEGRPQGRVLVSLADEQERLVDQTRTDFEGRFEFSGLPLGLYWVTVRRLNFPEDTVHFRSLTLSGANPAGTIELLLLPREIHEPRLLLHKPVLFRVLDNAGRPLDRVELEVTWSNGAAIENLKGAVAEDGMTSLQLIPGPNFVTLKRRGCAREDFRVNVAEGDGIDGFPLTLSCVNKM
jgi:hypothetical protein